MSSDDDVKFVETCNVLGVRVEVISNFPATSDHTIHVIIAAAHSMLTIAAIFLNACAVMTIWKTPGLREKLSDFTIMMQSTIDMWHGVLTMPVTTYLMLSESTGTGSCWVTYICKTLSTFIILFSFTTFSALNHERYMGVCHPIIHRTQLRKGHLLKFVVVVCLLQGCAPASMLYNNQIPRFVIGFFCLLFLAHTVFVYVKIVRAIQLKARARENQQGAKGKRKLVQYLQEIKATKTCFLIVICCILCYLPAAIAFSNALKIDSIIKTLLLRRGCVVLLSLKSSLNSIILFWKNKKMRVHAKKLLKAS